MATDPEALYTQVLQEEQQKGSSPPVSEGRAKAARARAEAGSPHPTEPKWWPGAQPHLEGGDGAAPAEEAAEEPVAEEAPEEAPAEEAAPAPAAEAPAAEAPAEEAPAEEAPAAQPPDLGEQEAPPAAAPPAQPAAATAPEPAAAPAPAAAATATATELPPDQRPAGVTHGTPGGNRLRPEDAVGTDAQFDGQQAVYARRKMIDDLVATGVPAVTAAEASRPRATSPASVLIYLVILVVASAFLVSQKDALGGGGDGEPAAEEPAGGSGPTISAASVQFDTDQLTLPAEETELEFVNEDSVQHNVSIYEDDSASNALFEGDIIPGGQSITYSIPALEKGNFYFQCDVHPSMNGTVTVE